MKKIILFLLCCSCNLFAATSLENRAGKKLELTFQAGGDYRTIPAQLSAMYFLDTNHLLGLKVGEFSGDNSHQTNLALQYKYYASNSFYLAGEVFYLNTREDVNGLFAILNDREYAEYKSMGAGIRIGNQWTWKNFTMGCDWFGIGRRVGTFEKESDKLISETFTFFNFIIGASF